MIDVIWLLIRWIHVMAAVIWIGGNLILAMVIVPYFKQNLPLVRRIKLLTQIGKRFEPIVWGCVIVLLFTGIANIFQIIDFSEPLSNEFVNNVMRTLFIKLILFVTLVVLTGMHSFVFGPRLAAAIETLEDSIDELPEDIRPIHKRMSIVSSLMGVVSLLILFAAVALGMGI